MTVISSRGSNPGANNLSFDNSTNGFASTNVQDAIEEAALGIINFTQAKAYIVGSNVIYVSFDQLVSQDLVPLTYEVV
jgi:hypothetical protein